MRRGTASTFSVVVLVLAGAATSVGAGCGSLKDADDPGGGGGGGDDAGSDASGTVLDDGAVVGPVGDGGTGDATSPGDAGPAGTGNGDPRWVQGRVPSDTPAPTDFTITNGPDGALVTDKTTGVVWQDQIPGSTTSYSLAKTYCENLVYDGFTDWRIPTRWEMISVLALSTTFDGSSLVNGAFSTPSGGSGQYNYWTQSSYASFAGKVWTLNTAGTQSSDLTDKAAVRCVRGPALPAPRVPLYDLSDPLVVRDLTTGLLWERTPAGQQSSLEEAAARCALVSLQGRAARLPTVKELASLVDETRSSPALAPAFAGASVRMHSTNPVWFVDFFTGSLIQGPNTARYARCVASP